MGPPGGRASSAARWAALAGSTTRAAAAAATVAATATVMGFVLRVRRRARYRDTVIPRGECAAGVRRLGDRERGTGGGFRAVGRGFAAEVGDHSTPAAGR